MYLYVQMRGRFVVLNWILSERITAAAAPLYQNLPCGNLTGYTVRLKVSDCQRYYVCSPGRAMAVLSSEWHSLHNNLEL